MSTKSPHIPDHESVKPEGLFDRLIQFSIHNAIWVMLFVAAWIAIGIYSYQKLPIDA
nr:cation transporter [Escherichia coli]